MLAFLARAHPKAVLLQDSLSAATPLMILCQRADVTPRMLESVLNVQPQAAIICDGYGASPVLTVSRRTEISTEKTMKLRAVLEASIANAVARERAEMGLV